MALTEEQRAKLRAKAEMQSAQTSVNMADKKYCKHCGQLIDIDCIICPKCGKQVEAIGGGKDQPIVINNSASSSASASASATAPGKVRRRYNKLLDLILFFLLFPIWPIWMLVRPKYE